MYTRGTDIIDAYLKEEERLRYIGLTQDFEEAIERAEFRIRSYWTLLTPTERALLDQKMVRS